MSNSSSCMGSMRAVYSPTWSQNGRTRSQQQKTCSAVSSKPLPYRAQSGMSARPALKIKPRWGKAFRASHQVSEKSVLFKKLDPGAQFQWKRISSIVQPRHSQRGSETEPTISSRYRSFRGRERLLNPWSLRRAAQNSQTNGVPLIGLRRPSAFGSDSRLGKVLLAFCLHTASPTRICPSIQVIQRASASPN